MNPVIKEKLSLLKPYPGCYLMKNKQNQVIYVGKAKRLDRRVNSYFVGEHSGKTAKMVSEVNDFDFIVTHSEKEAFLLEINLIHLHNPRYNIQFMDGKAYPYIQLHLGQHPYLSIARSIKDKKSKYFGPYSDGSAARSILNMLNRLYPLRKCNNIPHKPCLYYHMHQCLGPCINKVTNEDYKPVIDNIVSFLNGDVDEVRKELVNKMKEASSNLNFEEANEYKIMIQDIDHVTLKQTIQVDKKFNADIFGFHTKDNYISISVLVYRNGVLTLKNNQVLSFIDNPEGVFSTYILQYYEENIVPREVIIPSIEDIDILQELIPSKVETFSKGSKHDLLSMAAQNAYEGMEEKYLLSKVEDDKYNAIMNNLQNIIGVDSIKTIELIDNSHLQGSNPVSAVVVFENGKPNKKKYRKYQINNDNSKDDLANMYEVLYRRYVRKIVDGSEISDLLIVDGGEGQLDAAKKAIYQLKINIPIVGLVKNNRHTTDSLLLDNGERVCIKDNKDLLFFLTKMQDEVHRFVIGYHRDKRSKNLFKSSLDGIKGLGDVRKEKLLKVYGTVEEIRKLSVEELCQYLPKDVAINVYETLKIEN